MKIGPSQNYCPWQHSISPRRAPGQNEVREREIEQRVTITSLRKTKALGRNWLNQKDYS
jgi:hypothetical protein